MHIIEIAVAVALLVVFSLLLREAKKMPDDGTLQEQISELREMNRLIEKELDEQKKRLQVVEHLCHADIPVYGEDDAN